MKQAMDSKVIRYDSVRSQVYRRIRQNIEDGLYPPGEHLNEQQIAEELNVSRSPVREAIKQLTGDGFVVSVPNRGSYVKRLSVKELEDMYDMRLMIESYAMTKACSRLPQETADILRRLREEFPKAHTEGDVPRYTELDREFHYAIVRSSGNQYAINVFNTLYLQISMFRRISLSNPKRYRMSLQDHTGMIGHILAGNKAGALRLLRAHLLNGKKTVLRSLADFPAELQKEG